MKRSPSCRINVVFALLGLVLSMPAMYFFVGSFAKYEIGLLKDHVVMVPAPTVMIGGLLAAIGVNLYAVVRTKSHRTSGLSILQNPKFLNHMVIGIALLFLSLLLGYVVVENLQEQRLSR